MHLGSIAKTRVVVLGMIVWGSGGNVVNLGTVETRPCSTCEKDRPFNLIMRYRYFGLFWIFNTITEKKYYLLCDVCNRGWELENKRVEKTLKSVPIPWMNRYGILVLLGIPVGLLAVGALSDAGPIPSFVVPLAAVLVIGIWIGKRGRKG